VSIFITYAREDGPVIAAVRSDLARMHRGVWIDEMLLGGQQWWDVILAEIRKCDIYVFALSSHSLRSKPCRAELEYAQELGKVIVPIMVGDVDHSLAPPVVANAQVLDLRQRTADAVLALREALDAQPLPGPLPDPLPEPPPVPISYLNALADEVDTPNLAFDRQVWVVAQLKAHLADDDKGQDTTLGLLTRLRRRGDLSQQVAADIDATLESFTPGQPRNPWGPPDGRAPSKVVAGGGRSRRGLVVAAAIAAVILLGGGVAFGLSRSSGDDSTVGGTPSVAPPTTPATTSGPTTTSAATSTTPPSTSPTTAPAPTTTAVAGLTIDELEGAQLSASDIGAVDDGTWPGMTYPCNNTPLFSGMTAYFGRLLAVSDMEVATADVTFTTDSGAQDTIDQLSENGCNYFQHPDGEIETTTSAVHSTYQGAELKQYFWLQTGANGAGLVGYDTYVKSGPTIGFISCMSSTDSDPKQVVAVCDPFVRLFVRKLNNLPG
jgi:hypothetical protein